MTTQIPWLPGNAGGVMTSAEQLNLIATFRVPDLAALAAIDGSKILLHSGGRALAWVCVQDGLPGFAAGGALYAFDTNPFAEAGNGYSRIAATNTGIWRLVQAPAATYTNVVAVGKGTELRVDTGNTGEVPFLTIGAALDYLAGNSATPGQGCILLPPGTYDFSGTKYGSHLTIIGLGTPDSVIINGDAINMGLGVVAEAVFRAENVTLNCDIAFIPAYNASPGKVVLDNCVFTGQAESIDDDGMAVVGVLAHNTTFTHANPFQNLSISSLFPSAQKNIVLRSCHFPNDITLESLGDGVDPPGWDVDGLTFNGDVTIKAPVNLLNTRGPDSTDALITLGQFGTLKMVGVTARRLVFGFNNRSAEVFNTRLTDPSTPISGSATGCSLLIGSGCSFPRVIPSGVSVTYAGRPDEIVATATLDFPSISAHSSADLTMTVTGAAVGDEVSIVWPTTLPTNMIGFAYVSAANTVTIRLINNSTSSQNPSSASFKAIVRK